MYNQTLAWLTFQKITLKYIVIKNHTKTVIQKYTVARRCEFYVQVARRDIETLLLPREHKIHIFGLTG